MENPKLCVLTGIRFDRTVIIYPLATEKFSYEFRPVGKVEISIPMLNSLLQLNDFKHPILAGICRNSFINKVEPPIIDLNYFNDGYKNYNYPKLFKEKV